MKSMKVIILNCLVLLFIVNNVYAQEENPLPVVQKEPAYDSAPQFPGGPDSLSAYIRNNLKYPESLKSTRPEGVVMLKFTVTKKGKIKDVIPVNGVPGAPEFVPEAIRLVLLMPSWIPALKKGKAVDAEYQISIPFSAENIR
jgi:protein TonB